MSTMRAAMLSPFLPVEVKSVDRPTVTDFGILVKVWFAGVCHTDVHMWTDGYDLDNGQKLKYTERTDFVVPFPAIPGHEISGEVAEIGSKVPRDLIDYKVGDKVVVYPSVGCRNCTYCRSGQENSCIGSCPFIGINLGGGYGEYVLVPNYTYVCKVPDAVPMDVACLLPCSGITAYNAILKGKSAVSHAVESSGKATILIVGLGGLGCWGLALAQRVYPPNTKIVCADCWQPKLDQSLKDGASAGVLWDKSMSDKECVKAALDAGGGKVDLVLDFVGSSSSLRKAVECVKYAGTLIVVGLYGGDNPIRLYDLVRRNLTITGSMLAGLPVMKSLLKELETGCINAPPISAICLEQVQEALQKLKDGKAIGRSVIKHT